MENKVKLSIVIVNWNVRHYLYKCLKSILRYPPKFEYEIFVVDNNSEDKSKEMLLSAFSQEIKSGLIKCLFNDQNLGFAKANNLAIKQAKGDYILLLNPDTEILDTNTFDIVINKMESNEKIGILGCMHLNTNRTLQPSVRRFPTLSSQAIILLKMHHAGMPKTLQNYFALDFDYDLEQECDQVNGSFFLLNKKMVEQIGSLDENFWIWFEEVDLCKRAKDAGWVVLYTPDTKIVHHASQSFKQMLNPRKQREFNKSLRLYFKKHQGAVSYYIIYLLHPLSIFLSILALFYTKIVKNHGKSS